MSDPKKHHYLPAFYLSAWADLATSQLVVFSRPYGNVLKAYDRHPKATGYVTELYTAYSLGDDRNRLESKFLQRIDGDASRARDRLLGGKGSDIWPSHQRSAWTTFILTLLLRMPWDIKALREGVAQDFADLPPDQIDKAVVEVAQTLMSHEQIGQLIFDMTWSVFDLGGGDRELLTSDWPIFMTATLMEEDAFLLLPISPTRVFIAAKERSTVERMHNNGPENVYHALNRSTVRHAREFVFGRTRFHMPFIEEEMCTSPYESLMERLVRTRETAKP